MKIQKKWMFVGMVAVALGIVSGTTLAQLNAPDHGLAIFTNADTLDAEWDSVALIVRGRVVEEKESVTVQEVDSKGGIDTWSKTPAIVQIEEVLYGEAPTDQMITFLQHGKRTDPSKKHLFVKTGDQVILFLGRETSDGHYWSYRYEDGIWRIKNGKVHSNGKERTILQQLQNLTVEEFQAKVKKEKKE